VAAGSTILCIDYDPQGDTRLCAAHDQKVRALAGRAHGYCSMMLLLEDIGVRVHRHLSPNYHLHFSLFLIHVKHSTMDAAVRPPHHSPPACRFRALFPLVDAQPPTPPTPHPPPPPSAAAMAKELLLVLREARLHFA